jgi:hypothetical protein
MHRSARILALDVENDVAVRILADSCQQGLAVGDLLSRYDGR